MSSSSNERLLDGGVTCAVVSSNFGGCYLRCLCCSSLLSNPPTSPMWIQSFTHMNIEMTFIDLYSYGSQLSPIPRLSASSCSPPLSSNHPSLPPYPPPSNHVPPPLASPPPHFYPLHFLLILRNSNGTGSHKMSLNTGTGNYC